jgi:hypothetical protein
MTAVAYTFRGENKRWHGEPGLRPEGRYQDAASFSPFSHRRPG